MSGAPRTFSIPPGRRLVCEYLHAARGAPLVALRREFSILPLVEARNSSAPVSWIALFSKAYGMAAQAEANLRWAWIPLPWPRIYEHPFSVCSVLVERDFAGEKVILGAKVRSPETMPLAEFDAHVKRFRDSPVRDVSEFRQLLRLATLPWALRRFAFWLSFKWSGKKRSKRFGTFAVSSLGQFGTETLTPIVPLTTYLTYGPISADGKVAVGVTFDHRVMDARHAARALVNMERLLNTTIAEELRSLPATPARTVDRAASLDSQLV